MELKSLRLFLAIAETASFVRVAARCHTVQSNATAHIQKLEDELGKRLFLRQRRLTLTPAGRGLLDHARQILALHDRAVAGVQGRAEGGPAGILASGAMETTAAVRLPDLLNAYHRACPQVDLQLATGSTVDLTDRLAAATLDCVFVAEQPVRSGLHAEPAFEETLVLATDEAQPACPDAAELAALPFLAFRQGCHYRQRIERLLAEQGVTHGRIFEYGSIDAILGRVAAGVGYALLPRSVLDPYADRSPVKAWTLPESIARTITYLVASPPTGWSPALESFVETVLARGGPIDQDSLSAASTAMPTAAT